MKSILFTEDLFCQVVFGKKTQTRRIAKKEKKYEIGDMIYMKEPYQFSYHLVHFELIEKN